MLILLPPSEGKHQPTRGKPLDVASLSSPELTPERTKVLQVLQKLCRRDPAAAIDVLGLGPTQFDLVVQNSELDVAPTGRASAVYTGVLYGALDFSSLQGQDLRRANARLAIVSALFGLVRPNDRICAYRLSGGTKLPGVGALPTFWRPALSDCLRHHRGLVVDMLSSPYASMIDLPAGAVTVKVWQESAGGQRTAVSHFNKATKGELARLLGTLPDVPRKGSDLVDVLRDHEWQSELNGDRLDVLMRQ